jgi:hypothetical protein
VWRFSARPCVTASRAKISTTPSTTLSRRGGRRRPGALAGARNRPGREPARTGGDGRPSGPAVIHAMPMRTAYQRLLPKGRREQA